MLPMYRYHNVHNTILVYRRRAVNAIGKREIIEDVSNNIDNIII